MITIDPNGRFVYKDDDLRKYFISQDLVSSLIETTRRDVTYLAKHDDITYY